MEFLVSYKVSKRDDATGNIVKNINALVLDTASTDKHHIEHENVVDRNVLDKWSFEICTAEKYIGIGGYVYTILDCHILSFCKLGTY